MLKHKLAPFPCDLSKECGPISSVQMLTLLYAHLVSVCCSAVVLGAGELGLEPVLGGEEAVARQHRDQPHDL